MCGIFGLVLLKNENLYQLIINGLIQLQNRGYDSAGLCAIVNNKFEVYGVNGSFYWHVHGMRSQIIVEPNKDDVKLLGEGPYKYLIPK